MASKAKEVFLDYDQSEDILYIHKSGNFKRNLDLDQFVLDIDQKNKVIGIEIDKASKFWSEFHVTQKMLSEAKKANLKIKNLRDGGFIVFFSVNFPRRKEPVMSNLACPVSIS